MEFGKNIWIRWNPRILVLFYQDPDINGHLMDVVTDKKVEIAKETVKRGFNIGHYGDRWSWDSRKYVVFWRIIYRVHHI